MTKSKKILTPTESLQALASGKIILPELGLPHRFHLHGDCLQVLRDGEWREASISIDSLIGSYCVLVEVA